ncbi:hypothetical protein ILYODFUR_035060 [Ilyodon furcidens]|uniref:Uncharacterized protein n=1 Tax=Ilyodon furcidens TaxID=33524 RepID=A0ABV0UXW9_9TELE
MKSPPLSLYSSAQLSAPFCIELLSLQSIDQRRVASVLLRYSYNTAVLGIYKSSMLPSGSSWLFVSVQDASEAKKVSRASVSIAASWTLSRREVHLAAEAK